MKIRFNGKRRNYELVGNDKLFILNEIAIPKTGKRKGEEVFSPLGYYSKLENVLNKIVHLEIIDSEANSFPALLRAITDTKEYISTLVSESYEYPDLVA
jgi:hypothetical protein